MNWGVLNRVSARLSGWLALRIFLTLLAVAGMGALAAVLLDAGFDLSEDTRADVPWLLALVVMGGIAVGICYLRAMTEICAARLFERTEPSLGNRLSNAVQLASQPGASPVTEYLRQESIELGRSAAANLDAWPAVRRALQLAGAAALATVAGWICLAVFAGNALTAVAPRFLDPHGDHPPFSRLSFEVTPGGAEVLFGGQVDVKAKTSGPPVDKLWLVVRAGTNASRAMMFLAPDKSFFQTLANLREPAEYYVTDGRARSRKFTVNLRYTPQITSVEVTTTFPEYTGKTARTSKLGDEPLVLPEGTIVGFRIASNRPLKSGSLELTPVLGGKPVEVRLQPEAAGNIVAGSFVLAEPTLFSLSVTDVDGLTSAERRKGRINILPDERPRILVLEPGRDAVATPSIRIPVRVQASDDYAVAKVVWFRGFNGSIEQPLDMKLELKGGPQSVEATGAFDLAKLGVRPGDVIEYYFEAVDNYPKGPNVTLSRGYRLEIISEVQYAEILRQSAARQALFEPYLRMDEWLRRLAERTRELESQARNGSEEEKQAVAAETRKLAEDVAQFQGQLDHLLGQAVMFDVEKSFRDTLAAEDTQIGQVKSQLQKLGGGSGVPDPNQLADLGKMLSALAATDKQDVAQPASQIAAVARLMARADTFVKLAQQEAAVATLLRRYAESDTSLSRLEQMEVQELAHQQRLIEDGLQKFLTGLDESLSELPPETNYDGLRKDVTNFVAAVAAAGIEKDVNIATTSLAALDANNGHGAALSAAEKMDKLIARCNSMGKEASDCLQFQPKLQQAMGNTLQQILQAMGVGGQGSSGQNGYSLFNNDVGLYGPNAELAGEQSGARGAAGGSSAASTQRVANAPGEEARPGNHPRARVRLQTDAKFPLRYRDLVGDYFRSIADSQNEEDKK